MNQHISDIFEQQELEDKTELEDHYINVIRREFKDADEILSQLHSKMSLQHTQTPLILKKTVVRIATEFGIRKHTAAVIPYYHSHDFFEMIYVYEGKCRQYINEDQDEVILQKGEACFITPGTIHAILSGEPEDIILKMILPANMFRKFWNDTFEKKDELMLKMERSDEFCLFPLSQNQNGLIRWLFTKLLEEFYSEDCYRYISIKNYLSLLFVTLMRSNVNFLENGLLCQVSRQISSHLQNAQLKDIAKNMGYSPRHLERLLREKAGCTFSDVLQKLRLEKAAELLTETNDTIERIAELTGYQTEAGFYKGFRSFFGTTPNQYRKSHSVVRSG